MTWRTLSLTTASCFLAVLPNNRYEECKACFYRKKMKTANSSEGGKESSVISIGEWEGLEMGSLHKNNTLSTKKKLTKPKPSAKLEST